MEEFFGYLEHLFPLSSDILASIIIRVTKETHRKNKSILYTGHCCDWMAFIEKGLVKVCYDIPGGNERIISFQKAGEMVCAVKSFTTGIPSKVSIVTIEETVIRKIRKIELESICEKHLAFNIHFRKIMEYHTSLLEDHQLLLTLPAKERLLSLKNEQVWMLDDHRIKDYLLADYIGVDKATLSRWRRKK